jgi:hypothetical protein
VGWEYFVAAELVENRQHFVVETLPPKSDDEFAEIKVSHRANIWCFTLSVEGLPVGVNGLIIVPQVAQALRALLERQGQLRAIRVLGDEQVQQLARGTKHRLGADVLQVACLDSQVL